MIGRNVDIYNFYLIKLILDRKHYFMQSVPLYFEIHYIKIIQ